MTEIWQVIPLHGGEFEASNIGRIRRKADKSINNQYDSTGYKVTRIGNSYGMFLYGVHYLVWVAFNGKPKGNEVVMHLNSCRDDNRLENLKAGTQSENISQMWNEKRENETKFFLKKILSRENFDYIDSKPIEWQEKSSIVDKALKMYRFVEKQLG